ncbi:MAG: cytochrome C [Deltaproteobacteria bacterium]
MEPPPLTVAQCGQCHVGIFRNLKEAGGKHRFDCHRCHQQFHAYNPVKNNWAEIMPKCLRCHTEPPHGKQFTNCSCGKCHTQQNEELIKFPSAHTEQGCSTCHEVHGKIPSCLDCHEPHLDQQKMADCLGCHQAHKPLDIVFNGDVNAATCGTCHGDVYAKWKATTSKHGQVNCAECHTRHGFIPKCTSCHGQPHEANMLKKFPVCLDCHIDPHNLPVKK